MVTSKLKAVIQADIHRVWVTVTEVDRYTWRRDLSKTHVVNETQFIEYTKSGYPTVFTVTALEPLRRWEFDMENTNMRGHWTGTFQALGGEPQVEFTEVVQAKKLFLKPFVKLYLKRQQALFLADLTRTVCLEGR